jgi:hypothetical protein
MEGNSESVRQALKGEGRLGTRDAGSGQLNTGNIGTLKVYSNYSAEAILPAVQRQIAAIHIIPPLLLMR